MIDRPEEERVQDEGEGATTVNEDYAVPRTDEVAPPPETGGLHRTFSTKGRDKGPGPTFGLNDHIFQCRPKAPGLLRFNANLRTENVGEAEGSRQLIEFFEMVMEPDEAARFFSVIEDPEEEVEPDDVADIFLHLHGVYSGRPTPRLPASDAGQPTTGTTSTDG